MFLDLVNLARLALMRLLVFVVCSFWISTGVAQRYSIFVDGGQTSNRELRDSVALASFINRWEINQWQRRYYFAALDSIIGDSIYFHRGEKSSIESGRLIVIGNENQFSSPEKNLWSQANSTINRYVESGFPFARARLSFTNTYEKADVLVDPGPFVVFDSIRFLNDE